MSGGDVYNQIGNLRLECKFFVSVFVSVLFCHELKALPNLRFYFGGQSLCNQM
jgi:hypothetical protein